MNKHQFILASRGNIVPSEMSSKVLRARLSLRETQTEFGKRFMVTPVSIHNWETGKVIRMHRLHEAILNEIIANLKRDGHYLAEDIFVTIFRSEMQKHANAIES